jgi:hypothetical protein
MASFDWENLKFSLSNLFSRLKEGGRERGGMEIQWRG